jgi:Colicin V production protein/Cysteine-rich secretory protein family
VFDVVLAGILAFAVYRGWMRGFVRSAVGLVVVVVGSMLAFRLSGPAGAVVEGVSGASPATSRVIGGFLVFLACSLVGFVVARMMRQMLDAMPGLPTLDRAAGAAVAGLAGVLVVTLLVSAVRVLPLGGLGTQVEESELAGVLTDPDRMPQKTLAFVGGDQVLTVALRLDDVFGRTATGDPGVATVTLDVGDDPVLAPSPRQADALHASVNHSRSNADAAPLARSEELDQVARRHATAMYREGWMAHAAPDGTRLPDRLAAADIPARTSAELIGLGPSPASIVDAWESAEAAASRLRRHDVSRMGVAAVDGPLGLLAVVVMTG